MAEQRDTELDAVVHLEAVLGGMRLTFPRLRLWRRSVVWAVLGAMAWGVVLLAHGQDEPLSTQLAFAAAGTGLCAWACFALGNSLHVLLDQRGVQTERRLLGLALMRRSVPASDIVGLNTKRVSSANSDNTSLKGDYWYRIDAVLRGGKRVLIADSLPGRGVADRLLSTLELVSGYPRIS